jgi:hypothetical protein
MQNKRFIVLGYMLCSILFATSLHAQTSINTAGNNASGTGGFVNYSIGQMVYQNHDGMSHSMSEGVQHPFEIQIVTGIEDTEGINLSISAYPNPTINYLTLSMEEDVWSKYAISQLTYQLYDLKGNILKNQKIDGPQTQINMSSYAPLTYFIRIVTEEKSIKEFKIIKQ